MTGAIMKKLFTDHPESVGETYFEHFKYAFMFGFNMTIAGLACMLHAIFPFFFACTGSNMLLKEIKKWINRMPTIDERFIEINKLIEEKMKTSKKG
jgi:hypothetical protein